MEKMTGKEVYKLASELTGKEVNNLVNNWMVDCSKSYELYKSLVDLGDSRELACASVIQDKFNNPFKYDGTWGLTYENAYYK